MSKARLSIPVLMLASEECSDGGHFAPRWTAVMLWLAASEVNTAVYRLDSRRTETGSRRVALPSVRLRHGPPSPDAAGEVVGAARLVPVSPRSGTSPAPRHSAVPFLIVALAVVHTREHPGHWRTAGGTARECDP